METEPKIEQLFANYYAARSERAQAETKLEEAKRVLLEAIKAEDAQRKNEQEALQ